MKESEIQRLILDYLAARHILAFRMQTGASVSEYGGKKRIIRYGVPGMGDILAFIPANKRQVFFTQPLFIEVKSKDGRPSDLQRSFESQVKEHGVEYLVARSVDDVEGFISRIQS